MANVISKYGYLVKKVNDTWLVVGEVDGVICTCPIPLLNSKVTTVSAYDKTDKAIRQFAKDNGLIFVNDYEECINK